MERGLIVLQNRKGQVVRTVRTDADQVQWIYRGDTRRVEAVGSTDHLKAQGVPYHLLATTKTTDLKKSAKKLGSWGTVRLVSSVEDISPSEPLWQESDEEFKKFVGYSSVGHVGILGVMVLLGAVLNMFFAKPEAEPQVVTIYQEDIKKLIEKKPVVEAQQQKVVEQKEVKIRDRKAKISKKTVIRNNSQKVANTKSQVGSAGLDANSVGVLGVLGAADRKATGRGGYNVANAKSSGGFGAAKHGGGYGGTGAGGINRAIFGSGMIAGNPGPGSNAVGAGGYGTKGVGGGGRSGYGKLSMVGGSNGYFQPLESEAEVSGGLDQDQIAEVIRRHMGEVVNCYENALQKNPKLSGRMHTKFVIGGNGSVTSAGISSSSLRNSQVEGCVTARLRSWKFPTPVNNVSVKVSYPFAFRRVGQG